MAEPLAPSTGEAAAPRNLLARAFGVVFSPRATYADVSARPRVLGALLLVLLIVVCGSLTFFSTEVGRNAMLDQQVRSAESFGRQMTDAQYQRLERMAPYSAYIAAGAQIVTLPVMALVVAAVAFAIFNAVLGGDGTFKQVFAIVVHSGFVMALQTLFVLPLDYVRESVSSPTNLAVFLPFLDEATFVARLFGAIDLFVIWWMVSLSIGLGVLYRRRTGPIATGVLTLYVVIALAIAAVKSILSGA